MRQVDIDAARALRASLAEEIVRSQRAIHALDEIIGDTTDADSPAATESVVITGCRAVPLPNAPAKDFTAPNPTEPAPASGGKVKFREAPGGGPSLKEKVFNFVQDNGRTTAEDVAAAGICELKRASIILWDLHNRGLIRRADKGVYAPPRDY